MPYENDQGDGNDKVYTSDPVIEEHAQDVLLAKNEYDNYKFDIGLLTYKKLQISDDLKKIF